MSRFNAPIVITPLSDGKTWKLLSDLRYEVGGPDSDNVIKVPIGFYTDFASIPHIFRRFLPRWGKYGYASIIHDFLYWERKKKRREADKIFLEAMTDSNVPAAKKYPIYWAVYAFGWWAWLRNRQQNAWDTSLLTDNLLVTPLPDGKTWILVSEYRYEVGGTDSDDVVEVPIGFYTSFESMPDVFWSLFPKWGKYAYAAIMHDWLYWEQPRPRLEADQIFLEALTLRNIPAVDKYVIYSIVRFYGWWVWRRNWKQKANAN